MPGKAKETNDKQQVLKGSEGNVFSFGILHQSPSLMLILLWYMREKAEDAILKYMKKVCFFFLLDSEHMLRATSFLTMLTR